LHISSRSVNKHGGHRQFLFLIGRFLKIFSSETAMPNEPKLLPSFGSFDQAVTEEKNIRNRTFRNKNCLWRPCLLTNRDDMSNFHIGPSFHGCFLQALLVSDWSISKKSSLKSLDQMNKNLVGSINGRFSIKIAHFVPIC
jgi:hypothetical protein